MKNLSIRTKISLWFTSVLVVIVALTYIVILSVSGSVIQKTIQDNLINTVSDNVDEVEFFSNIGDTEHDNDADVYIEYSDGYLEVDDDYLDLVNGISTALYVDNGVLLYGENPIAKATANYEFSENKIQHVNVNGITYYVFDKKLTQDGLDGLWLRGVVSEEQGSAQLSSTTITSLYLLPLILLFAGIGGYIIAGKTLNPIKKIESAAVQISHGQDLKKRIELSPGTDELHQLAGTFNEMFERLEGAFESEQQFTSDASHELRTPLSVVLAQCEYSLEQARTQEEYEAALRMIQRQSKKMNHLIEDMLRFVRLEQKTDRFPNEMLDYSDLVSSICQDMALLKEHGIILTCDVQKEISILANRELLSRMIINLISNAYRYGRENGFIKVTLTATTSDTILTVCDNGIGISPEHLDKIFNRFYQVDASRTECGTGLGLAMVKEIVKLYGGEIRVESEPDKGSRFEVVIKKST